jgi:hypothetical protein
MKSANWDGPSSSLPLALEAEEAAAQAQIDEIRLQLDKYS